MLLYLSNSKNEQNQSKKEGVRDEYFRGPPSAFVVMATSVLGSLSAIILYGNLALVSVITALYENSETTSPVGRPCD
jgi:hypothetical protein